MTVQAEVFEAFCSALYNLPFSEFLGENDREAHGPEGRDYEHLGWFHLGESPKDMRVSVIRPERAKTVSVHCEWRNYFGDARKPLKGSQTFMVETAGQTRQSLQDPTTNVMVRVLELYRDILGETGVAGNLADLQDDEEEPDEEE